MLSGVISLQFDKDFPKNLEPEAGIKKAKRREKCQNLYNRS